MDSDESKLFPELIRALRTPVRPPRSSSGQSKLPSPALLPILSFSTAHLTPSFTFDDEYLELKSEEFNREVGGLQLLPGVGRPETEMNFLKRSSSRSSMSEILPSTGFFACPVEGCLKKYKHKGDLKSHAKRKHQDYEALPTIISKPRSTKEKKPFRCPVDSCSCGYVRKRDLIRHFRVKHGSHSEDYVEFFEADNDSNPSNDASS